MLNIMTRKTHQYNPYTASNQAFLFGSAMPNRGTVAGIRRDPMSGSERTGTYRVSTVAKDIHRADSYICSGLDIPESVRHMFRKSYY